MQEYWNKITNVIRKFACCINKIVTACLVVPFKAYQKMISPCLPKTCRFTPSCSQYMIDALRKRGPVVGLIMGIWRIFRCNPLGKGGYDPVRSRKNGEDDKFIE